MYSLRPLQHVSANCCRHHQESTLFKTMDSISGTKLCDRPKHAVVHINYMQGFRYCVSPNVQKYSILITTACDDTDSNSPSFACSSNFQLCCVILRTFNMITILTACCSSPWTNSLQPSVTPHPTWPHDTLNSLYNVSASRQDRGRLCSIKFPPIFASIWTVIISFPIFHNACYLYLSMSPKLT